MIYENIQIKKAVDFARETGYPDAKLESFKNRGIKWYITLITNNTKHLFVTIDDTGAITDFSPRKKLFFNRS